MSFSNNITEATLMTDVRPNSTPSEFANGVYALGRLWSAAHVCPWSWQSNRRAFGYVQLTQKNVLYPVGMPVWGCEYGYLQVGVCFTCSGTNRNRITFVTPDDDTADYGEQYNYAFTSWYTNRTDTVPTRSDWGVELLFTFSDAVTTSSDVSGTTAGVYMGCSPSSSAYLTNPIYKPTTHGADLMGYCMQQVSSGVLSAGFLKVAKDYLTKLLDSPLFLWAHTCVPRSSSGYCVYTYDRGASGTSAPTGYVDPNVVTMPHLVPFREGDLPARCNKLHFAIWEHDWNRSTNYQYRDFELWVEIGGVQYQAWCIQCADIDDVWNNGLPGRLIMAEVQGPPNQAGSQMIHGRRYWTVRVARYGRQSYNDKGETNGMWMNDIGSISCWLGGEEL